jgi:glycine cleavage system T protein
MTRRTRLHELQRGAGALFAEHQGWEVPERFSAFLNEYHALRNSVGLLDYSNATVLEVTGRDRIRFLQGMLTNDIKSLQPGQGCYAAMLTSQGRIVADMQVYCGEGSLLLTAEAVLREKLSQALKKYIIADQVELKDCFESEGILSVQGPRTSELLSQLVCRNLPLETFNHVISDILGTPVRLCRNRRGCSDGYDLVVPQERLAEFWGALLVAGAVLGIRPVGWEAFNANRIEAGIPLYGIDMDENNLLLEAGLLSAVSFTKGCYMGQEIVARATYRGQVNWKLSGLLLPDSVPLTGRTVVQKDGKEVGRVTSSTYSPALNRAIAMGYLRREVLEPGTLIQVDRAGDSIICEVTALPFVSQ